MSNFIDLWYGRIRITDQLLQRYGTLIDAEERRKADSLRIEASRSQYIVIHGTLRTLLSRYTGVAPQDIKIGRQKHGKPFLPHSRRIVFNLSHSDNIVLIGITSATHLGVDIEVWKDRIDYEAIAKQCFAPHELDYWEALPEARKLREFYRFWTRKEAFVKAVGCGIGVGLDRCIVFPQQPSQFLSVPESYGPAREWKCVDLDLGQKICAAFVVRGGYHEFSLKEI